MQIPVLIEPIARNGYAAKVKSHSRSVKGAARGGTDETAPKIESRLKKGAELVGLEVGAPVDPWMAFAGIFKDDPWIEDWKQSVKEYRKKVDEDPDAL